MSKKNHKIWTSICSIIFLAIIMSVLIVTGNKSIAFYSPGDKQNFGSASDFLGNDCLYCLNHGKDYVPNATYFCYAAGTANSELSYIIAQQTPHSSSNPRSANNDLIANAVWVMIGEGHTKTPPLQGTAELNDLLARATLAASIKASGNISITGPQSPVIESDDGKYGPFKITYPSHNNKVFAVTSGGAPIPDDALVIKINGKTLTNIPESGKEFYLTENDGIKHGEKNEIEVFYNGYRVAPSNYAKFTPERAISRRGYCTECGGEFIFRSVGFCVGSSAYDVPPMNEWSVDPNSEGHRDEKCQGTAIQVIPTVYYQDNYQNLIYLTPMYNSVHESKKFEFWAGKPEIEINIDKVDTSNKVVPGVTFSVSVVNGTVKNGTNSITTGNDGKASITIKPNKGATQVKVILTETKAPANYIKYKSPIELIYDWDNSNKQWKLTTINKPESEKIEGKLTGSTTSPDKCSNTFTITAVNRPIIRVYIKKTDANLKNISTEGNPLSNIKFNLDVTGGKINAEHEESKGVTGNTLVTDSSGEGVIIIEPNPGATSVTLVIKEEESIYYVPNKPITINFTYDSREGQWSTNNVVLNENNLYKVSMQPESKCEITIKNIARVIDFELQKTNISIAGEKIPGITFRIELKNARTRQDKKSLIVADTNANGEIEIGELEVIDPNQNIEIILEEIGVPNSPKVNYKGLYGTGSVTISFRHKQAGCQISRATNIINAIYNLNDNILTIEIGNEVTLDLAGKVWEDMQHGVKPVTPPNGVIDSDENGMANIVIRVINSNGNVVDTTVTDSTGEYEFNDLPASVSGAIKYYIEFTFDGIHYIVTPYSQRSGDSVVQENNRDAFNKRFETITKGKSNDGTTLEYTHDANSATLIVKDSNGIVLDKFAMIATTLPNTYSENTTGINMGLVAKEVDLAAVTDINKANVTINGKEKEYSYNDIISMNYNIAEGDITDIKYNLYLYRSDYNYRINDYQTLPTLPGTTNTNLSSGDYSTLLERKKEDRELQVQLTYDILLNNQSANDARINEIVYYYDDAVLELVSNISITETLNNVNINGKSYRGIRIPIGRDFPAFDQAKAQLVFNIKNPASAATIQENVKNWVEITSYSTQNSCIDKDSAPDNISEYWVEDDSDDATTLTVQTQNEERIISGYVFEDLNADGKMDANEIKVNDVIVQLIEIKEVNNKKLEYIWQETVSGQNAVKYINNDGTYDGIPYDNHVVEDGKYEFNAFIPGNYIIRFIYGDGTYYDTSISGGATSSESKKSIRTYNGQDYKSTIDRYYKNSMYNGAGYNTQNNENSKARDNEARRLQEMAYATKVTSADSLIINEINTKDKLNNTWMCAETSEVLVSVEGIGTDGIDVAYTSTMNFGLMKRPQPKLVLEKHITYLNIQGTASASADIQDYFAEQDGYMVKLTSSSNLGVIASGTNKQYQDPSTGTNGHIGSWLVQTDLNSVIGQKMDIVYGYLIKNEGKPDYVSDKLYQALQNSSYDQIWPTVKQEMSISEPNSTYKIGEYLGEAYYSGNSYRDTEIGAIVRIEDYLHKNQLQLKAGEFKITATDQEKAKWKSRGTAGTESVTVVDSHNIQLNAGNVATTTMEVFTNLPSSTDGKGLTFRSYAAQLVPEENGRITTITGVLIEGSTLNNLKYVQADTPDVPLGAGGMELEDDEFLGEYVQITKTFGGDEKSPIMLIVSIAGGLAIITVGIILIKKFIIK